MTDKAISAASRASKEALFCIGSNCGDRHLNVSKALDWLKAMLTDFRCSRVYTTPDCHGGMREYLNAVCLGTTTLLPEELESKCKRFEETCGRDAEARAAGNVPVDVDLVVFDGEIMRDKDFRRNFFRKGYREIMVKE